MPISMSDLGLPTTLGNIDSVQSAIYFVVNFLIWIGWAGVILGVGYAFFRLIYALMISDDSEKFEIFKGELVRAIMISVIGILIVSAGYIVITVGGLFGESLKPTPPNVFE